jgi:hypothetical protein
MNHTCSLSGNHIITFYLQDKQQSLSLLHLILPSTAPPIYFYFCSSIIFKQKDGAANSFCYWKCMIILSNIVAVLLLYVYMAIWYRYHHPDKDFYYYPASYYKDRVGDGSDGFIEGKTMI